MECYQHPKRAQLTAPSTSFPHYNPLLSPEVTTFSNLLIIFSFLFPVDLRKLIFYLFLHSLHMYNYIYMIKPELRLTSLRKEKPIYFNSNNLTSSFLV